MTTKINDDACSCCRENLGGLGPTRDIVAPHGADACVRCRMGAGVIAVLTHRPASPSEVRSYWIQIDAIVGRTRGNARESDRQASEYYAHLAFRADANEE